MLFQWCFRILCKTIVGSFYLKMLTPVIIQPLIVLFVMFVIPENMCLISLTIGISLGISIKLAKHDLRSHLLYYWVVLSIIYTTIAFAFVIVPLSEIEPTENYILILFSLLSTFFLYLTAMTSNDKVICNGDVEENRNGELIENTNGNGCAGMCPVCKIKMHHRNYHCHICQECIPNYDHHSYWLNCCIGEVNLHYYVAGIFFGVFALTYASLLILTTICSPQYKFGILLPDDCVDIGGNIEMYTCLVCGIYCLELAVILLFKLIFHSYLISRGMTLFEWSEQYGYSLQVKNPYSSGFTRNWIKFFKKFKRIKF